MRPQDTFEAARRPRCFTAPEGRKSNSVRGSACRAALGVVALLVAFAPSTATPQQAQASVHEKAQEPAPVSPASVATTNRFDGDWTIRIDCPASVDAPGAAGYGYDFPASILNGRLFGSSGQQGAPGSMQVEGSIGQDGDGRFQAHGRTGGQDGVAGRPPAGTAFSYDIQAHFDDARGTGRRLQERACNFTFGRR
jgi:hypothetical protein